MIKRLKTLLFKDKKKCDQGDKTVIPLKEESIRAIHERRDLGRSGMKMKWNFYISEEKMKHLWFQLQPCRLK